MMAVVVDLLENPRQAALQAVAPSPGRYRKQEQGGEQPEKEALQHKRQPVAEQVQHQRRPGKDEPDPQQKQRDQQQHRFMESPRANQGLPFPEPKRRTTGAKLVSTRSNAPSLSSTTTTSTESPHKSLSEPNVASEGAFGYGYKFRGGSQTPGVSYRIVSPVRPQRAS